MHKASALAIVLLAAGMALAQSPQLVLDINPGVQGSTPYNLKELNGRLIFQAYEPAQGRQLWATDGTPGGTVLLKELVSPQFAPGIFSPFFKKDNYAWVWARDGQKTELWRTDGTSGGTQLLFTTFENTDDFFTKSWITSRGLLALRKNPLTGEIATFLSDGTPAGTGLSGWEISNAFESSKVVLDSLYYLGYTGTPGDVRYHIYQSDGTAAGTSVYLPDVGESTPVKDQRTGPLMNLAGRLSYVLFTDTFPFDGYDQTLNVPGFPAVALLPHQQFGYNFAVAHQTLFYEAPAHPDSMLYPLGWYAFDGLNTQLLLTYQGNLPGNEADILAATDAGLVLRENKVLNSRLWRSDGTPAGSKVFFEPTAFGLPDSTQILAGKMIDGTKRFVFQTATPDFREHRFWEYDWQTEQLNPLFQFSSVSMYGAAILEWLYFDGHLYFTADDGLTGSELWRCPYPVVETKEPVSPAVQVWPNPCSDILHLRSDQPGWWTLFDGQGSLLLSRQIAPGAATIELRDCPAGILFYSFQPDGGQKVFWGKLVKQ